MSSWTVNCKIQTIVVAVGLFWLMVAAFIKIQKLMNIVSMETSFNKWIMITQGKFLSYAVEIWISNLNSLVEKKN